MAIYFTSDLHFCHDRGFVYGPRGFKSVDEMNKAIVKNWNSVIKEDDDVYVLGDIMLNDNVKGMELLQSLKGRIHIVRGNHDTDERVRLYKEARNVVEVENAIYIKYKHYRFYLSHYPTMTSNLEKESLKACLINCYGHTHQHTNFYQDIPFMFHVGLDSHNNTPVLIDDAIDMMYAKAEECLKQL